MRDQNLFLKYYQSLELFKYFEMGVKFFYTGTIDSVGQMAKKLLALIVRGVKEKSAISAITAKMCASTSA